MKQYIILTILSFCSVAQIQCCETPPRISSENIEFANCPGCRKKAIAPKELACERCRKRVAVV